MASNVAQLFYYEDQIAFNSLNKFPTITIIQLNIVEKLNSNILKAKFEMDGDVYI
jgi:hypothetical protein